MAKADKAKQGGWISVTQDDKGRIILGANERDPKGDGSFTSVETLRTWTGPEQGHSDHGVHAPYLEIHGASDRLLALTKT